MEQVLLVAEEARSKREPIMLPEVKVAPSGKPRARLRHSPERPTEPAADPAPAAVEGRPSSEELAEHEESGAGEEADPEAQKGSKEPPRLFFDDGTEVDRVLLAKEFFGLLQVDSEGDEASS
jgi:hypothetical protein